MSETETMRQIMLAISGLPGALFYRRNVGVARTIRGEMVRFGIPGQADIGGIYRGRAVEVEVKTDDGRLSAAQKRWMMAVERAGGVFVVARNPADALEALAALDAQSGRLPEPSTTQPAEAKSAGNGEAMS
jgi:hypothetical protein